jgi:hypothetical protein
MSCDAVAPKFIECGPCNAEGPAFEVETEHDTLARAGAARGVLLYSHDHLDGGVQRF